MSNTGQNQKLLPDDALDPPAIIEVDGRSWSHQELRKSANRLSRALKASGLNACDTVAVISPNCREYLSICLAVTQSGLYCVPINWRLASAESSAILENSGAKIVFFNSCLFSQVFPLLQSLQRRRILCIQIGSAELPGFQSLENFSLGFKDGPLEAALEGRLLGYTSATTGTAKGVLREIRATAPSAPGRPGFRSRNRHGFDLPKPGVHLCCSQFYHSPILNLTLTEIAEGNAVIIPERWDPIQSLALIERFRVTTLFMVPSMFVRMLKIPANVRDQFDLSSLQFVLHSGAPCPIEVKREMIGWWGPILWERYGSVEGPVTLVSTQEWITRPGTVGKAVEGISIKILDQSGKDLPPRTVGRIYIRSRPEFEFAYKGDPEKTQACRIGDYYTVGDDGFLDEDGYLYLSGRGRELIISGGVNIYASEIEQILVQHAAVLDCAVIGVPHDILGEVPKAIVQLTSRDVKTDRIEWELMDYVGGRIATYKVPHVIEIVAHIPRDPNGKLYKRYFQDSSLEVERN